MKLRRERAREEIFKFSLPLSLTHPWIMFMGTANLVNEKVLNREQGCYTRDSV
jgi:hypothetical protein